MSLSPAKTSAAHASGRARVTTPGRAGLEESDSSETSRRVANVMLDIPPTSPTRPDFALRMCLLGDASSGKRHLLHSLAYRTGATAHTLAEDAALEAASGVSWTLLHLQVDAALVRVQAFDNTGRDGRTRFGTSPFSPGAFHGMDIILVVYDMGDRDSFDAAVMWLELVAFTGSVHTVVLVANKYEKAFASRRCVPTAEGREAAEQWNALYTEASSEQPLRKYAVASFELAVRYALLSKSGVEGIVPPDAAFPDLTRASLSAAAVEKLSKAALMDSKVSAPTMVSESTSSVDSPSKKKFNILNRPKKASALLAAVQAKDVPALRTELATSLKPSALFDPQSKASALIVCASQSKGTSVDLDIAALLLENPITDPDAQNATGETALMVLAQAPATPGNADFARLLLSRGVNVLAQNSAGLTVYHLACQLNRIELLRMVLEHSKGVGASVLSAADETPVYVCCKHGHFDCLELLLACDDRDLTATISVGSSADHRATPLHAAVLGRFQSCIAALLNHAGVNVNAVDSENRTPLYHALELRDSAARDLLLCKGADARIGEPHRVTLQASFFSEVFAPAHMAWLELSATTRCDISRCHLDVIPPAVFRMHQLTHLNVCGNLLGTLPRQVTLLTALQELLLQDNRLRALPPDLTALTRLATLRIEGNIMIAADFPVIVLNLAACARNESARLLDLSELGIQQPCEMLALATHIEELALFGNSLLTLPTTLTGRLRNLWLQGNRIAALPDASAVYGGALELLNLSDNVLLDVEPLKQCAALRELWVERNGLTAFPAELASVTTLQRLWADSNAMASIPADIGSFLSLRRLSLKCNQIHELPAEIGLLTNLERLWLDGNALQRLPSAFASLTQLETLSLSGNPFRVFPAHVVALSSLVELAFNDTLLEEIDPTIGSLVALKKLGFRNCRLRALPQTMGHMTNLTQLDVTGNPDLTSPPPETVKNGTQAIVWFLHDLIADSRPSYRMKLMVVGQEAVGKTTLLRTLIHKRAPAPKSLLKRTLKNLSTDGIDIENWERKIKLANGSTVKVQFKAWDFAGQEVYYSTHGFFLSQRSIYLVVWSMLSSEDQQRVPYWLQSIQSRAQKAPVLLVGTHAETLDATYVAEYGPRVEDKLRAKFPNLNIVSFTAVSASSGLNMKLLQERLDHATMTQPFMGEPLPLTYLQLENAVESEKKRVPPVMSWDDFLKLGVQCSILREEGTMRWWLADLPMLTRLAAELVRATALLHDMGSLLCFRGKKLDLSQFVILDPQWLTKMMAQVITSKTTFVRNGVLDHVCIPQMWRAPEYPPQLHPHLLKLLQAFDVSFRLDMETDLYRGKSLIPAMLSAHHEERLLALSTSKVWHLEVGRVFLFDFIPAGFFSRLTVRLLLYCTSQGLWADLLVAARGDAVAVVSMVNSTIEVRVRSDQDASPDVVELLRFVVQSLEGLCEGWFQIRTETLVPCIHCIARKAPRPHLFDLQECEQAAAHGVGYLTCSGQFPVALQSLCPDILVSSELPVVKWDALHNMERVGEGTFAYVYRALLNQEEGALPISNKNWAAYSHLSQVAVKRLIDETDFRELRKEAASLLSLKHRNVVTLHGVCFRPAALVTEFMHRGSLFDTLHDETLELPWTLRVNLCRDVANGMCFLHTATPPVLHRDLKSANVLLTRAMEAKLSDFGTAVIQGPFNAGRSVTNPRWLAPEVLLEQQYGAPSDVYGFAICMWEVATRQIPFSHKPAYNWSHNVEDDVCRGVRPPTPDNTPAQFVELMTQCWAHDPSLRPTFDAVSKKLLGLDMSDVLMDLRAAKRE